MKLNRIISTLLFAGLGAAANAQSLQFKPLNGASASFQGVAYGGSNNFVAVGSGGTVISVTWSNSPSNTNGLFLQTNSFPNNGQSLNAVAFGNGLYLTGGDNPGNPNGENYYLYSSTNGGTNWAYLTNAFADPVVVKGIAFNGGAFAAAASFPEIGYSTNFPHYTNWSGANIASVDLEFFRAICPLGANGFAVCGVGGDIRTNQAPTNSWNPSLAFSSSNPTNLLGIAASGATVVCVGGSGVILTSTHGGVAGTWTNQITPANLTAANLNAVTYSGYQFVAAGSGGTVLLSSNGLNWTNITIPGAGDLYGISIATNGPLQGVGLLVGTNGTVVVGGYVPAAPTAGINVTNCAGTSNNLGAFPVTNSYNPFVTVDWYATSNGAVPLLLGSTNFPATGNPAPANAVTNYYYYAQSRDLRTGFVSSNRTKLTLTLYPVPTSQLVSANQTNCNEGAAYSSVATLTGIAPWFVTWSSNGVLLPVQTITSPSNGPVTITNTFYPTNSFGANAVSNNVYYVAAIAGPGICEGTVSGTNTVTVYPRPTATLTNFSASICNGPSNSYVLTNTLTGIGPFTLTWNDGTVQTTNGPGPVMLRHRIHPTNSFATDITSNNVYFVSNLVDGAFGCAADTNQGDIQGSASVVVYPVPATPTTSTSTYYVCPQAPVPTFSVTEANAGAQVNWYASDQTTLLLANSTNYTPSGLVTGTNLYFAVATYPADSCSNPALEFTVVLNPLPPAPANPVSRTNCFGVANPGLSVSVAPGETVDWYDQNGDLVASGTNTFFPPLVILSNNPAAGITNVYYTQARMTNADCDCSCTNTNQVAVYLCLQACSNVDMTFATVTNLGGATNATNLVLEWYGGSQLQAVTNFPPSNHLAWITVSNGVSGTTNVYPLSTNGIPGGSNTFFRLFTPTNYTATSP